ncbi:MAG: hypothetical protein M3Q07_00480, partial [Pseudobdellovibrionaceae bacterium]|nr:hypothetical protein [Pseudobdellovibrionaceae bacterium]
MNMLLRITKGSLLLLVLSAGCNNDKSSSTPSASTFSCTYKKAGELTLCTQYQALTGSTLTSIQSECELRGSEGYSWAVAACPARIIGSWAFFYKIQIPE